MRKTILGITSAAAVVALGANVAKAECGDVAISEMNWASAAVVTAVRSVGMFSPRRVVLVKDVTALDGDPDVLKSYAKSPPPESYLLVRAPTLDKRRKLHNCRRCSRLHGPQMPAPGGRCPP